jgi:hypothetical protein
VRVGLSVELTDVVQQSFDVDGHIEVDREVDILFQSFGEQDTTRDYKDFGEMFSEVVEY